MIEYLTEITCDQCGCGQQYNSRLGVEYALKLGWIIAPPLDEEERVRTYCMDCAAKGIDDYKDE